MTFLSRGPRMGYLSQPPLWPRDNVVCCQTRGKKFTCAIAGLARGVLPHTFLHGFLTLLIDAEGMGTLRMEGPQRGRTLVSWVITQKSAGSPNSTPTQQRYLQSCGDCWEIMGVTWSRSITWNVEPVQAAPLAAIRHQDSALWLDAC